MIRAVLFDLDGTLLNTLHDIANAANRVLQRQGYPVHPIEAFRYYVGDGASVLFERILPEGNRDRVTIERCLAGFREDYGVHWNVATTVYPGVAELLDGLSSRGLRLAVLSNKPHSMTVDCVEGYLSRWMFGAVLGQREGVPKKPDPAGALEAATILGVPTEGVMYVGDTGTDMKTAVAGGMVPVGALWGFRPEDELRQNGALFCISRPEDLLLHLERDGGG
jgi:phosphoglycolate phosphatase